MTPARNHRAPSSHHRPAQIIFLNRFFHPDHSATSQMLSDVAFGLAENGHRVRIIASRQRYDAPGDVLAPFEAVRGVAVHRVWTSGFGRQNLLGRALDYLTFCVSAGATLWRLARAGDVVVAKTDPPLLSVLALPIARMRGAKLINWLQDIFPEAAEALGLGRWPLSRAAHGMLRKLRDRSLTACAMNVALGERMADFVRSRGVPAQRLRIIPNFADGALIEPKPQTANGLRKQWGLGDTFVVGYAGNLGRPHEYATLLDAACKMEARAHTAPENAGNITFLIVGGGCLYDALKRDVAERGLSSVRFQPYQPRDRLSESLGVADVHMVSLRPQLEGLIVPSKFYGIAAAGRPALFVGDPDGEIARLIARYGCGRTIRAGDGAGLAQAIIDLAASPSLCEAMGKRARCAFEAAFDKAIAVSRWEALLADVEGACKARAQLEDAPLSGAAASARNVS